jgi:hypothetical protein
MSCKDKDYNFKVLTKHQTYSYLNNLVRENKRVVVSRYGDGEYFIVRDKGRMRKDGRRTVAKQTLNDALVVSLRKALIKKNQLICLPHKTQIKTLEENDKGDFPTEIAKFLIRFSHHSLYGQVNWVWIDLLRNKSNFITNFFVKDCLFVTGHKEAAENAFASSKNVKVFGVLPVNAFEEYEEITKELKKICRNFKNIVFACGPVSNILLCDLIDVCDSNLVDWGSAAGVVINPFATKTKPVKSWSGWGKRASEEEIKRISENFFETLDNRIKYEL